MLKKLIVVYNPRSSKHAAVAREVLEPARKLSGWLVGKYEVKEAGLRENAEALAEILNDGDLVIAAGGDGTAAMAVNGVMQSEKEVALGVLGYGNFNDCARMLGTKRAVEYGGEYIGGVTEIVERYEAGKTREIYPLEAIVDGRHWRYAPCYLSIGMLAESTAVFDEPKVREKLKVGKRHLVFSLWTLAKWYFRNRRRGFLPENTMLEPLGFCKSLNSMSGHQELVLAEALGFHETDCRDVRLLETCSGRKSPADVTALAFAEQVSNNSGAPKVSRKPNASAKRVPAKQVVEGKEKTVKAKQSKQLTKRGDAKLKREVETAKISLKEKREAEAAKTERAAEQKKFKKLLKAAKRQQLREMGAGVKAGLSRAGAQIGARVAVAKTGAKATLVNAKIKAEDRAATRKKAKAVVPEIIIEGAEVVEKRKRAAKVATKKSVACAAERVEKNRFKAGATDYIAVNGPTLAGVMRGGRYYRKPVKFRSMTVRLSSFWRLVGFMVCSVFLRVPGRRTRGDVIKFKQRVDVMIQAEGEYERLEGVKRIVVRKAERGVRVVG